MEAKQIERTSSSCGGEGGINTVIMAHRHYFACRLLAHVAVRARDKLEVDGERMEAGEKISERNRKGHRQQEAERINGTTSLSV